MAFMVGGNESPVSKLPTMQVAQKVSPAANLIRKTAPKVTGSGSSLLTGN